MAHKTFISYKYSESRGLRDTIIGALGKDATYYKGENVDSKDMTDYKRETIRKNHFMHITYSCSPVFSSTDSDSFTKPSL